MSVIRTTVVPFLGSISPCVPGDLTGLVETYQFENPNFSPDVEALCLDSTGNIVSMLGPGEGVSGPRMLIKSDTTGNILWAQSVSDGTGFFEFSDMTIDDLDNVYLIGTQFVVLAPSSVYDRSVIIKIDSAGVLQWQRALETPTPGNNRDSQSCAPVIDTNGDVYWAGGSYFITGVPSVDYVLWLAKYDSDGVLQWQYNYTDQVGTTFEYARSLDIDSAGNLYVAYQGSAGQFCLGKFSSSGTVLWSRRVASPGGTTRIKMSVDPTTGDIYFTSNRPSSTVVVAKYNTSGTVQWQKTITYGSALSIRDIRVDAVGDVYVSGRGADSEFLFDFGALVKYDSSGNVLWERKFTTCPNPDGSFASIQTIDFAGTDVYVGGLYVKDVNIGIVAKIPGDGTGMGTYCEIYYIDELYTHATYVYTSVAAALTKLVSTVTATVPSPSFALSVDSDTVITPCPDFS